MFLLKKITTITRKLQARFIYEIQANELTKI